MKNPHLTLPLIAMIVLLTACERGQIPDPYTTYPDETSRVESRCCDDDLIGDLLNDPLYQEVWDNIYVGLLEPSLDLFEAMDTAYLFAKIREYESCILAGEAPELCVDALLEAFDVKDYFANLDLLLLDSLRQEYAEVSDEDFYLTLEAAIASSFGEISDDRRLPCFAKYQADLQRSSIGIVKILAATTEIGALAATAATLINIGIARAQFCACLYNNYGTGC